MQNYKAMKLQNYICMDLETTGLNPKTDRIIEIGAVKVRDGEIAERFETFVNPGKKLEERITELTGITDEMLADAQEIQDVLPDFLSFLGEDVILGHAVLFDYSFVKKAVVNARGKFERKGVDTLAIARKYLTELESRSLGYLCSYFEIPHKAHRALADAEATHLLYQRLWKDFSEKEDAEKVFAERPLLFQVKRDQPATKAQIERLYKLIERHKIEVDYLPEKLTRSEASRNTDRILAEYGRLTD